MTDISGDGKKKVSLKPSAHTHLVDMQNVSHLSDQVKRSMPRYQITNITMIYSLSVRPKWKET